MERTITEQQIEVLKTADEYIVKLITGINTCINDMEKNEKEEPMELIPSIIEGIDWLNEVARLTKDMQKKNMDEEVMRKKLEDLREYASREDYNEILSLLKYEILDILTFWKENINRSLVS